jgi:CheY-like chemotaxis protein
MRILVADDDRVISLLVCGILRDVGHQTLAAFDQMQTLMFAMRSPAPHLIVLDLNMPGGAGGETLRRLKQSGRTSHVPVIVVSGTGDADAPARVRELGGAAFLPKPVDREALVTEVDRVLAATPVIVRPPDVSASRFSYE